MAAKKKQGTKVRKKPSKIGTIDTNPKPKKRGKK